MMCGVGRFALQNDLFITSQHNGYPTTYPVLRVAASVGIGDDIIIIHSKLKIGFLMN
jgi:hypothetical protein